MQVYSSKEGNSVLSYVIFRFRFTFFVIYNKFSLKNFSLILWVYSSHNYQKATFIFEYLIML